MSRWWRLEEITPYLAGPSGEILQELPNWSTFCQVESGRRQELSRSLQPDPNEGIRPYLTGVAFFIFEI